MKNWKTTLSGLVGSLASLLVLMSTQGVQLPKWLVIVAGFVAAGGFAALGISGKDSTSHSTLDEVMDQTSEKTSK